MHVDGDDRVGRWAGYLPWQSLVPNQAFLHVQISCLRVSLPKSLYLLHTPNIRTVVVIKRKHYKQSSDRFTLINYLE